MIATLQRIVDQRENEITQQLRYLFKKRYELIPTPNILIDAAEELGIEK